MKLNKKIIVIVIIILVVTIFTFAINQVFYLQKAHSTFDNYYSFRGCTQLLSRTDSYGICKIASGKTIKIVRFQGKWYLDGDLPCGFLCF
jgi:uncharacterized membrane protein YqiK